MIAAAPKPYKRIFFQFSGYFFVAILDFSPTLFYKN
jgi:hypothetical protein